MGFKVPARIVLAASQATPGHSKSFSSRILNPQDGPIDEESYSLRISTRELPAGIFDEELFARFTKGAFGGWILTPERWIAPLIQRSIHYELILAIKTSSSDPSTPPIWKLDSLSRDTFPPLGSTLFGLFILFDTSLAASHRFEVTRKYKDGEDRVKMTFSHIRSDPRAGGKSIPSWFVWFHVLCSGLLFADGIRKVIYT
ncbi:hypothetical protein BO82DRAFT_375706 [Aspergillus uvarum CBS 121591]|uniref:Uncharacterized protein n=1 Tax=Aspergillus uvarum CBS 121591 TaxID=1448315 RepID=A0A319CNE1_9EURO|nr:hypothetical protein BO82DRAFT_375706 [Aspergillus uvarum CBS 121591]PYH80233.1 hypothetical protein BO82DRAFT_375706 [Aspergillus uvarum CBS 121591]